ncbi:MAG: CHRD domain-containing protein [Pseudomonadota bacterium]|nr:CHRD domain-containing protein [Pseudomonadota bacterium]
MPPMTLQRHLLPHPGASLALLAAVLLLGACSSVDLGPRYDPPPVQTPQPLPSQQPPGTLPPVAQPSPVPPTQHGPQPPPPVGTAPPMTTPGQPTAPAAPVDPADPRAHLVTLTTRLDGLSAMPPTRSSGSAQLDALYDGHTRLLRWRASWTGLAGAITGVQFHGPGGEGQVAPATLVWPGPFGPSYEGRATLTPEQAIDLMGGRWYINVQTSAYPSGEVRGQVRVVH